jgi:alkylhydroperoxidase family enzyme
VAQQEGVDNAKIEATWDMDAPVFTPRERSALEMATIFTQNYHDFSDEHFQRWKRDFSEEELIELAAFMAVADGFGKVVEMLGLGDAKQVCDQ